MYIVSMQQCSVGRCCVPYHTLYWNVLQDTISGVVVMMNGSRYQTPCHVGGARRQRKLQMTWQTQ